MTTSTPSPNGPNRRSGRRGDSPDATPASPRGTGGRFLPGNAGGPGNPFAKRVGQLRSALIAAVTAEDITAIVAALILRAKEGDVVAAREVLDRLLGRPVELDLIERLEHIEQELAKLEATP